MLYLWIIYLVMLSWLLALVTDFGQFLQKMVQFMYIHHLVDDYFRLLSLEPPIILESEGDILIAISSIGMVYVWDIIGENSSPYVELCTIDQGPRALHPPVSIAPVLDGSSKFSDDGLVRAPKLTHASVTPQGKPVVTLSSGESFIYSAQMMVWTKVSENWWAGASQYWDTTTSSLSSISNIKNIKGNASNGLITLWSVAQLQNRYYHTMAVAHTFKN